MSESAEMDMRRDIASISESMSSIAEGLTAVVGVLTRGRDVLATIRDGLASVGGVREAPESPLPDAIPFVVLESIEYLEVVEGLLRDAGLEPDENEGDAELAYALANAWRTALAITVSREE